MSQTNEKRCWEVHSTKHPAPLGSYSVGATACRVAQRIADNTGREIIVTRSGSLHRSFFPLRGGTR